MSFPSPGWKNCNHLKITTLLIVMSFTNFDIILYHGGCPDGTAAAWVFWNNSTSSQFIGMKHGQRHPNVTYKRVAILDFSFPRSEMEEIIEEASFVLLLDHHVSAQKDLQGLEARNYHAIFDIERSGAQLAWDYVYPGGKKYPRFINIIADRDLWRWKIPLSKEMGKALYLKGWYVWDKMSEMWTIEQRDLAQSNDFYNKMAIIGETLIDGEEKDKDYAKKIAIYTKFTGADGGVYRVYLTTCQPNLRSEVGNEIASRDDCDFVAIYRYDYASDEWWISLRTVKNIDLPNITRHMHNVGGHKKASGFTIKSGEKLQTYFKTP